MSIIRRSLTIGINYTGTTSQLGGCINDCDNLKEMMRRYKVCKPSEVIAMTDKKKGYLYPTRKNILTQFRRLVELAKANPKKRIFYFFSYSGHGTQIRDTNGDEADNRDEALCPIDYETAGFISDDYIKKYFVDALPRNVYLVMLMDACHSGTITDLKYNYALDRTNKCNILKMKNTVCKAVMISGSRDNQTSADAYVMNRLTRKRQVQGAMTAAFITCYRYNISYRTLVIRMRRWLKRQQFAQVPQLSAGITLNTRKKFLLERFRQ